MSIANKYNKVALFTFSAPKDFDYKSLHDLYGKNGKDFVYEVKAMYINKKSNFGESPVIATRCCQRNDERYWGYKCSKWGAFRFSDLHIWNWI